MRSRPTWLVVAVPNVGCRALRSPAKKTGDCLRNNLRKSGWGMKGLRGGRYDVAIVRGPSGERERERLVFCIEIMKAQRSVYCHAVR